ncbi:hypothetical protein [Kallotenue papyrolyticum]|uniref:hypothetical protein n=1 Tax=Kallotenue papyrolyticum TaxID=1325125 RepID=UPI001267898F|nr:hypothetical protein [Kallotenue papyrolyticum]
MTNYVNVPNGRSSISGVKRRVAFLIGEQVCMYGGYSVPNYQCGYIQSKTYLYDGQPTWILVQNPGVDLSRGGDSGAPWFWGNTAYGMHSAGAGNDAIFMATDYFDAAGVYILTGCPFC